MNKQRTVLSMAKGNIQKIVFSLFFILLLAGTAAAARNHYAGHEISFDYP